MKKIIKTFIFLFLFASVYSSTPVIHVGSPENGKKYGIREVILGGGYQFRFLMPAILEKQPFKYVIKIVDFENSTDYQNAFDSNTVFLNDTSDVMDTTVFYNNINKAYGAKSLPSGHHVIWKVTAIDTITGQVIAESNFHTFHTCPMVEVIDIANNPVLIHVISTKPGSTRDNLSGTGRFNYRDEEVFVTFDSISIDQNLYMIGGEIEMPAHIKEDTVHLPPRLADQHCATCYTDPKTISKDGIQYDSRCDIILVVDRDTIIFSIPDADIKYSNSTSNLIGYFKLNPQSIFLPNGLQIDITGGNMLTSYGTYRIDFDLQVVYDSLTRLEFKQVTDLSYLQATEKIRFNNEMEMQFTRIIDMNRHKSEEGIDSLFTGTVFKGLILRPLTGQSGNKFTFDTIIFQEDDYVGSSFSLINYSPTTVTFKHFNTTIDTVYFDPSAPSLKIRGKIAIPYIAGDNIFDFVYFDNDSAFLVEDLEYFRFRKQDERPQIDSFGIICNDTIIWGEIVSDNINIDIPSSCDSITKVFFKTTAAKLSYSQIVNNRTEYVNIQRDYTYLNIKSVYCIYIASSWSPYYINPNFIGIDVISNASSLKIHPNPVTDGILNIINEENQSGEIYVYSITGKLESIAHLSAGHNKLNLTNGLKILKIEINNQTYHYKILVE